MDDAAGWYLPIARAVPAIVLAAVITFTADHSAGLGFVTFGIFGILSGAVVIVSALRRAPGVVRGVRLTQGGISVLAGVVAIAVPGAGLPFLVFLVTAFAVVTGFLEFYLGLRGRRSSRSARDPLFVGALTILLAVGVLLVPPGYSQSFTGPDGITRELTASVIVVGLLGAYWAIAGVYLVIAGLSLKWGTEPHEPVAAAKGGA